MTLLMLVIVSCGKDEGGEDKKEEPIPTTPKMESVKLDKVLTTDDDTTVTYNFLGEKLEIHYAFRYVGSRPRVSFISFKLKDGTYFQNTTYVDITSTMVTDIITTLEKDITIDTNRTTWFDKYNTTYSQQNIYANSSDLHNNASIETNKDVYVAFRTKTSADEESYKYGWFLMNFSSDLRTISIKEAAISLEADVVIKTGAK